MADATDVFSGRSQYTLRLRVNHSSSNTGANTSVVSWSIAIIETSEWGSWSNSPATWSITVDGQTWSGSATYDFRNYNGLTLASGTKTVTHNSAGAKRVNFSGSVGGGTTIGSASASGYVDMPTLASAPDTPALIDFDEVKATSVILRYFADNNGSAITKWEIQQYFQWTIGATTSQSATTTKTVSSSAEAFSTTMSGLRSGSLYRFRARATNGRGASGWSGWSSIQLLPGVVVSDGTTWKAAEVFQSIDGVWVPSDFVRSNGSIWKTA